MYDLSNFTILAYVQFTSLHANEITGMSEELKIWGGERLIMWWA